MATTGTITITGLLTNAGISLENLIVSIPISAGLYAVTSVTLVNGNNTVTIPTGTTLIIIQLPAGNTNPTALKSAAGDGNTLLLAPNGGVAMIQITNSSPPASFVLNANGAHSAATTIKFI